MKNARRLLFGIMLLATLVAPALAQHRLKEMPSYKHYVQALRESPRAFKSGALSVQWKDGGKAFEYSRDGKRYRYNISAGKAELIKKKKGKGTKSGRPPRRPRRPFVKRGRQTTSAVSPDGKWKAFYKDHNLWLTRQKNGKPFSITTKGNEKDRLKFGTASWVYGEELRQRTAMWWSPDSRKIAFYHFDESKVRDYYLTLGHTKIQNALNVEPFPKPGAPNPVVDICLYDLETKETIMVDVRDGKPFADDVVGHYVYDVSWTQDGKQLLLHRTNRFQNVLEICAADPNTGACRVIVREEWLPSWTENSPTMRFLKDGKRFILASDRTGWHNYYLCDLGGKLIAPLTKHCCDCAQIVRVDEDNNVMFYMTRSGVNHMMLQLHRVGLDGSGDQRLTDPDFNHRISMAPDGKHFVAVSETHEKPPTTRLFNGDGKELAVLEESDTSRLEQLGISPVEMFEFKSADGKTMLHGMLQKPSNFDPAKKYPLLVSVYAGPGTNAARETFRLPSRLTEFGFLIASFDARGAGGRGKKMRDALYQKMGVVEIDDLAAGVKHLRKRPYVDGGRVGIHGTSYGGYASLMCLLRHPGVFHAACASSSVTDWRNYDTIYTERYMRTPQTNKKGYDAGNAMKYVKNLRGRLMIYFGTADNNVYPAHSLQLIAALQKAGKSFDVQIGSDSGHSGLSTLRMMEYFIENLVRRKSD